MGLELARVNIKVRADSTALRPDLKRIEHDVKQSMNRIAGHIRSTMKGAFSIPGGMPGRSKSSGFLGGPKGLGMPKTTIETASVTTNEIRSVSQLRKEFTEVGRTISSKNKLHVKEKELVDAEGKSVKTLGFNFKNVLSIVKNLATGFGVVGGAMAFANIIKSGEEFERKFRNSLAIMGEEGQAFSDKMRKVAFEVAAVTKFSAAEVAEAYYFLASAGMSAAQSIKAMGVVANFAQAGNFDLARATELLADSQAAMGLATKDPVKNMESMQRVADVLVKANTLANASTEEFALSLTRKSAAAARIAGIELEEVVSVLAAFAKQGTKSYLGGQAVNIVLRDLTTKAIVNKEAFKKMNVAVFDSMGNMNKMSDVVRDLEVMLGGLSAEEKKTALHTLGLNDKSLIFLQTLIGTSREIKEYEDALKTAGGLSKKVADVQLTPVQKVMAKLGSQMTEVGTILNEKLFPALASSAIILGKLGTVMAMTGGILIKTVIGVAAFAAAARVWNAVMVTLTQTYNLATVAATIFQAITGGPFSWGKLVAGAAAAVTALVAVNHVFASATKDARQSSIQIANTTNSIEDLDSATRKAVRPVNEIQAELAELDQELTFVNAGVTEFVRSFVRMETVADNVETGMQSMLADFNRVTEQLKAMQDEAATTGKSLEQIAQGHRQGMIWLDKYNKSKAEYEERKSAREKREADDKADLLAAKHAELGDYEGRKEKGETIYFDWALMGHNEIDKKIERLKAEIEELDPVKIPVALQTQISSFDSIIENNKGLREGIDMLKELQKIPGAVGEAATTSLASFTALDDLVAQVESLKTQVENKTITPEEAIRSMIAISEEGKKVVAEQIAMGEKWKDKSEELIAIYGSATEMGKFWQEQEDALISAQDEFDAYLIKLRAMRDEGRIGWGEFADLMKTAEEKLDNAMGGPLKSIEDMRFENDLLNASLSETEKIIARFNRQHAGATAKESDARAAHAAEARRKAEIEARLADEKMIADFIRDAWKEEASVTASLIAAGKSLKESLRTPSEILSDKIKEWTKMVSGPDAVITPETYMRALMKEKETTEADIKRMEGEKKEGARGMTGFADLGRMVQEALLKEDTGERTVKELIESRKVLVEIEKAIEKVGALK